MMFRKDFIGINSSTKHTLKSHINKRPHDLQKALNMETGRQETGNEIENTSYKEAGDEDLPQ